MQVRFLSGLQKQSECESEQTHSVFFALTLTLTLRCQFTKPPRYERSLRRAAFSNVLNLAEGIQIRPD